MLPNQCMANALGQFGTAGWQRCLASKSGACVVTASDRQQLTGVFIVHGLCQATCKQERRCLVEMQQQLPSGNQKVVSLLAMWWQEPVWLYSFPTLSISTNLALGH